MMDRRGAASRKGCVAVSSGQLSGPSGLALTFSAGPRSSRAAPSKAVGAGLTTAPDEGLP